MQFAIRIRLQVALRIHAVPRLFVATDGSQCRRRQ